MSLTFFLLNVHFNVSKDCLTQAFPTLIVPLCTGGRVFFQTDNLHSTGTRDGLACSVVVASEGKGRVEVSTLNLRTRGLAIDGLGAYPFKRFNLKTQKPARPSGASKLHDV